MPPVAHQKRLPLHPLERALLFALGAQLVFVCWAFGGMVPWAQWGALGLGTLAFTVSLLPRRHDGEESQPGGMVLSPWSRLRQFPLFWLGLALGALVVLQGLNPSWRWMSDGKMWWMRQVDSVAWLPTSTDTAFATFNLWRQAMIYAAAWLTVCALWAGLTRRRSLQILFGLLVGNGIILAIEGYLQLVAGTGKLLWLRAFPGTASFGSFVYRNHGGAYLGLMVFASFALMLWQYYEARRRLAKSSPAALWALAAILLIVAVVFTLSRGAIILVTIFGLGAMGSLAVLRSTSPLPSTVPKLVTVSLVLVVLGCVGFLLHYADFSSVRHRFEELWQQGAQEASYRARVEVRDCAERMLRDHWLRGTGAGSFRFLFPLYIKDNPYLYEGGQAFWQHAHIDWLEIPIELGLTGVLLVAGALGWCGSFWWRHRGWRHPVGIMILLGLLQTMGHALIDFPFQNTAVLITWWSLLVLMLRWLEFEGVADGAPALPPGLPRRRI